MAHQQHQHQPYGVGAPPPGAAAAAAASPPGGGDDAVAELEGYLAAAAAAAGQHDPVAAAHAALQELRDSGDPRRLFPRCLLQLVIPVQRHHHQHHQPQHQATDAAAAATVAPGKEELFFHCATGFRQVALGHWTSDAGAGGCGAAGGGGFSPDLLAAMRDYLAAVGHALSESPSHTSRTTCRLACYTASVAMWKRGWDDDELGGAGSGLRPGEEGIARAAVAFLQRQWQQQQQGPAAVPMRGRNDLFRHLETYLFPTHPEWAATLCSCLVGEFSGKSAAVSYRLPLEFHKSTHRSFEKIALLPILTLGMSAFGNAIGRIGTGGGSADVEETAAIRVAQASCRLLVDVLGWEFGLAAWSEWRVGTNSRALIRPPVEWRDTVARVDLVRATFHVHRSVAAKAGTAAGQQQQQQQLASDLAHDLRQLLLQLASLSGPMFIQPHEKQQFASALMEGTLELLVESASKKAAPGAGCVAGNDEDEEERLDLLDALQLTSRIVANFRLSTLVDVPSLVPMLRGITDAGLKLLKDQAEDCRRAGGDSDAMEHRDYREEALSLLLECAVLLSGDPWILYSGTEESRKEAKNSLAGVLGPLYEGFVQCRTQVAAMEEHYAMTNDADLDETRELILETDLEEEMSSIATVGRLNLSAAIACLSNHFGRTMPSLQALWDGTGEVTPHTAALLEESRMLTMYICHLLTDNNEGETPTIPDAIVVTCQESAGLVIEVAAAVQALFQFAESQVQKIAENPANRRLSPLLGRSFLWFLNRWAPAYVHPTDYGPSNATSWIVTEWSTPQKAQQIVTACISLCLHYQCYWPHEPQVQEAAGRLLMSLSKRGGQIRSAMVASQVFHEMVRFYCLTAAVAHSATHQEFEAAVRAKIGDGGAVPNMNMLWGYQRLPYQDKARILTSTLVACSDTKNAAANVMITDSLKVIHDAFTSLVTALASKQVSPDDVGAKEMAGLCVEMFSGVAHASEMSEPERLSQFITPYLPQLSGLMAYYAKDLTICETLLRFFRDYTEQFITLLDPNQSLALFKASAELLESYSSNHCELRVIEKKSTTEAEAEEEQAYSDILCAIQLLTNLGAKDFIDACSTTQEGVTSTQVTDMIFFGLQQILPLMTQGLLQYPLLCSQFFELVGFMMDTYPEKVCSLPYEFFSSLLESLMFGMSHHSLNVARPSLQGIAGIAKEHLTSRILTPHLTQHPDIFDKVSRRLLAEVVFQNVVIDRVEAAGYALLPLVAVDINRFGAVVQDISSQVADERQRARLQSAFQKLIQPEAIAKVAEGGYEGRMNRVRFKSAFEEFVNEVHSFLVLR